MSNDHPADYEHLLAHAQALFPDADIKVIHTPDEIIHIDIDDRHFTFEIGSDDDAYIFGDGQTSFIIPLTEILESSGKKPDISSAPALIERSCPTLGDD